MSYRWFSAELKIGADVTASGDRPKEDYRGGEAGRPVPEDTEGSSSAAVRRSQHVPAITEESFLPSLLFSSSLLTALFQRTLPGFACSQSSLQHRQS